MSDFPKLRPYTKAVGYWGGDISARIDVEEIPAKIRVLLQDKLRARGKKVFLWNFVDSSTPGVIPCSCVKNTTARPDNRCDSCYGSKFIPGYLKLLNETLFAASVSSGLTLSNVVQDTSIKTTRLVLSNSATSGFILTSPIPYDNTIGSTWEFHADYATIEQVNAVTFSFSTDGTHFWPIANINDLGKQPLGVGTIIFRVDMSRPATTNRSPMFEILRARHPTSTKPYIKILRPWVQDIPTLIQYGLRSEDAAYMYWTAPLDFFDSSITRDTPAARVLERAIYQRITGIDVNNRYIVGAPEYNEQFGIFTWQHFKVRRVQQEEIYNLVF